MAVIYYGEGDHPAGFVGYRAATTLGEASEFRQKYYAFSHYSPAEAERLAYAQDDQWRTDAEAAKRDSLLIRKRPFGGAGVLVQGLRAAIRVEKGRKAHYLTYITPCFIVTIPGYGKGERRFVTTTHGLDWAFEEATTYFSNLHGLTPAERAAVQLMKPDAEMFTSTLRIGLLKRGINVSESEIQAKLHLTSASRN